MGFWIKEKQEYRRVFLLKGVPIRFPNVERLGDFSMRSPLGSLVEMTIRKVSMFRITFEKTCGTGNCVLRT